MRRGRRFAGVAGAALVATLLLAAAGGAVGAKEGGTFRIAEAGLFGTIDPAHLKFAPELEVLRTTCGALVAYPNKRPPAGFRVEPDLAEALPRVSRDAKTFTFTIRKDARFSNGAPVLARDFVHAFERILDPAMKSPGVPYIELVAGAHAILEGKTKKLAGATARGRTLTLRMTRPAWDFPIALASSGGMCAVPSTLSADPEGARAPLPSAGPYYVSEYVPGERVVLLRNRFYRGPRPHHVDRFVVQLGVGPVAAFEQVLSGSADYALGPPTYFADKADTFVRRYGLNKTQFFAVPAPGIRMFALNSSRPLLKGNVKLRQAINFAVDRPALARELGPYASTVTDQFIPPNLPGHVSARIYPLTGPDLRKARALAAGNTRTGKAVLYTSDTPVDIAQAQILQQNLARIGIALEIQKFPIGLLFDKLATPGEPFDIGRVSWGGLTDPGFLNFLFDGRTIGQPGHGNWSYFDSSKFNRMLDRAARIPLGPARYRAYGEIDVQLSRDAAPAIPYGILNQFTLVSSRVGCIVVNPALDLTAACLK